MMVTRAKAMASRHPSLMSSSASCIFGLVYL
jgi:hypothetical protein